MDGPIDKIFQKSCASMAEVPDGSVHAIVTSPPFETQRRYSDDPADHGNYRGREFIESMRAPLAECFRILRNDGSAFVNFRHGRIDGFASPTLHLFPALLADVGFKIVQELAWMKVNAQPIGDDRLLKPATESIYHVAKTDAYFADKDAVRVKSQWAGRDKRAYKYNPLGGDRGNWFCPALEQLSKLTMQDLLGALLGDDVDALPLRKSQDQASIHPAKMPDELADWLIRYGSREGDIVCDPWTGSATTLCRAKALGRRWLGYELSAEYVKLAESRVAAVTFGEALTEAEQVHVRRSALPEPPAIDSERTCGFCGAPYKVKRRSQKFCSSRCRYTSHNRANTRVGGRITDGKETDADGSRAGRPPKPEDALHLDVQEDGAAPEGPGAGLVR